MSVLTISEAERMIGIWVNQIKNMFKGKKKVETEPIRQIATISKPKYEEFNEFDKKEVRKLVREQLLKSIQEKYSSEVTEIKGEDIIAEFEKAYRKLEKADLGGKFEDLLDALRYESLILLVIGRRGSGKSVTGFKLLENIHALNTARQCYVIGSNPSAFPDFIDGIEDIDDAQNGSIVLVDEGALQFNARRSQGDKAVNLTKLMAIARHKDLTLIFITQNSRLIDINCLSMSDILVFKEPSIMQEKTDRKEVKKFYQKIKYFFMGFAKKERKKFAYWFGDDFRGFIGIPLPSFWSDEISKSYSGFGEEENDY